MRKDSTIAAASLAVLLAGSASAFANDGAYRAPPYGYFVWRGPDSWFPPHSPPSGAIPLVDYQGMTPGYAPLPRIGCYFTRGRINSTWRRVEVCY